MHPFMSNDLASAQRREAGAWLGRLPSAEPPGRARRLRCRGRGAVGQIRLVDRLRRRDAQAQARAGPARDLIPMRASETIAGSRCLRARRTVSAAIDQEAAAGELQRGAAPRAARAGGSSSRSMPSRAYCERRSSRRETAPASARGRLRHDPVDLEALARTRG